LLGGVIFDMDGVLIDSHPAHKAAWRRFLQDVGKEVSDSELDFVLDGRKRQDILRHYLGDLISGQLSEYGRIKDAHFLAIADSVQVVEGLPAFLTRLESSAIPKAVATSATEFRARDMLERLNLTPRFAALITSNDVVNGKPDPAVFRLAAARLGKDSAELLVVEDAVSGVKAAKSAGMKCLGIGSGQHAHRLVDAGAELAVPNFTDIRLPVVEALFNE
jgi:beta-phosphoglucomutase